MTSWPDHYPDGCPPSEAQAPDGNLFRYTNRKSPHVRDFKTYHETYVDRDWGKAACKARGLSVFCSMSDCLAMEAAVPAMKKKHIAVASLSSDAGLVAQTPSTNSDRHHTFWTQLSHEQLLEAFAPVERPKGTNND